MLTIDQTAASDWIVFTDLDGTLLDHANYTAEPARPAIKRLAAAGIPIVFATSKTLAEIRPLSVRLNIQGPAVAENGGVLAFPPGWLEPGPALKRFSPDYAELIALLDAMRTRGGFRFQGFHDLSTLQVAMLTRLSREQAALARTRDASEPILWQDSDAALEAFRRELAGHDLGLLRGGRFHHVIGARADKARALGELLATLRARGWRGRSIALGDAPNDHGMLSIADYPVIVHNARSPEMPPIDNTHLLRTTGAGPDGWREAIDTILDAG